jgi:hypothetical protein
MAGGTHVFDMIKRLRDNDNLRKNDYFKVRKMISASRGTTPEDQRALSANELNAIRLAMEADRKKATWRQLILLGASVLLCGLLIMGLLMML